MSIRRVQVSQTQLTLAHGLITQTGHRVTDRSDMSDVPLSSSVVGRGFLGREVIAITAGHAAPPGVLPLTSLASRLSYRTHSCGVPHLRHWGAARNSENRTAGEIAAETSAESTTHNTTWRSCPVHKRLMLADMGRPHGVRRVRVAETCGGGVDVAVCAGIQTIVNQFLLRYIIETAINV